MTQTVRKCDVILDHTMYVYGGSLPENSRTLSLTLLKCPLPVKLFFFSWKAEVQPRFFFLGSFCLTSSGILVSRRGGCCAASVKAVFSLLSKLTATFPTFPHLLLSQHVGFRWRSVMPRACLMLSSSFSTVAAGCKGFSSNVVADLSFVWKQKAVLRENMHVLAKTHSATNYNMI